jgi:hypothetical protein
MPKQTPLSKQAVAHALEGVVSHLDYDLHKDIQFEERDGYGRLADQFIKFYVGAPSGDCATE